MSPVFKPRYRLGPLAHSFLAAWCAAACTTWSPPYAEPLALSPGKELAKARLNLRNGSSLIVYHAQVRSDSVVGMVRRQGLEPISVSLQNISGIQVREIDGARTLVLVGAIVGGILWTIGRGIREGLKT
jgi:hypothetical protein